MIQRPCGRVKGGAKLGIGAKRGLWPADSDRLPGGFAEAAAQAFEATLEVGDLLFIPAWWFHTFLHLGDFNSNVNFWWKPTRPQLNRVAARQALLDAVAVAGIATGEHSPHAAVLASIGLWWGPAETRFRPGSVSSILGAPWSS